MPLKKIQVVNDPAIAQRFQLGLLSNATKARSANWEMSNGVLAQKDLKTANRSSAS